MQGELDWQAWERLPRLGLIGAGSRVSALPELAASLGFGSLWIKRDDELAVLRGGSKPRKLDYLLARDPFLDARVWRSAGAIGSGHLVALAAAAVELDRRLEAHCFPQPYSRQAAANAALLCRSTVELKPHRSRLALALTNPRLLCETRRGATPVVAPGATSPSGMLGFVRAAFELADQVRLGALPAPDCLYVAFGSGGTVAGLSVGLALAGLTTRLYAVASVEAWLSSSARLGRLQRAVLKLLRVEVGLGTDIVPLPVHIDRGELGDGYADPTPSASDACALLAASGVPLEPAYTGKVMAALLHRAKRHAGEHVVVWNTARAIGRDEPGPLPPAVEHLLLNEEQLRRKTHQRRRLVVAIGVGSLALLSWRRLAQYGASEAAGDVLSAREAAILLATASTVVPLDEENRPALIGVVRNIARYLRTLPQRSRRRIRLALAVFEQATVLTLAGNRFTRLDRNARDRYLDELERQGGTLAQIGHAVRDLCLLGYYQSPEHFEDLDYEGPPSSRETEPSVHPTESLRARRGQLPPNVVR